jgi:hypothetical protein
MAIERLIAETRNLRAVAAAIEAIKDKSSSNMYLQVSASTLRSDLTIRLIRIFEDSRNTSSFWYLHRCQPLKVNGLVNVQDLKGFSNRLKKVRDKVFVHIDKDEMSQPDSFYRDAKITYAEIHTVIEDIWRLFNQLYLEQFGKAYSNAQTSFDSLCKDFEREFLSLQK